MKFTRQQIEDAAKASKNFCETCKALGCRHWGGAYYNICSRIKRYGIDVSHFDDSHKQKARAKSFERRRKPDDYLVNNPKLIDRPKKHLLKRCLLEAGVKLECAECGNKGYWNGKPLELEIDHIDGNWKNNLKDNLRFLCPNCHAQTDTFGNKKRDGS